MVRQLSLILLQFLLLLAVVCDLYADTGRGPLRSGMTAAQVTALWGAPEYVVEQEIRRQTIWRYPAFKNHPETSLRFVDGQLVLDNNEARPDGLKAESVQQDSGQLRSDLVVKSERRRSFMELQDHKMLDEILREVPADGEPAAAPAAANNPAQESD